MKKIFKLLAASPILVSNFVSATPLGFANDPNTFIDQGYNGFNYGGGMGAYSWVNDSFTRMAPSFGIGPTALGAAWDNAGTNLTLTSSTLGQAFDFSSVSLDTSHTVPVTIQGLLNGVVVNSWTGTIVNQASYTNVLLNWTKVDEVTFSAGNYDYALFVTNIDADVSNVPEPASAALLGLGIAGMAFMRRRKAN